MASKSASLRTDNDLPIAPEPIPVAAEGTAPQEHATQPEAEIKPDETHKKKNKCFIFWIVLVIVIFLIIVGALVAIIMFRQKPEPSVTAPPPKGERQLTDDEVATTTVMAEVETTTVFAEEETTTVLPETTTPEPVFFTDCDNACEEVKNGKRANNPIGFAQNGTITKILLGSTLNDVYCDCREDNKNWLVFQRRFNGSVNFYRRFVDYINGFGDLNGELWLGLDAISNFTANGSYELRVDLGTLDDSTHAEYRRFHVADATGHYLLTIGGYKANVGAAGDSLSYHNGGYFCTWDHEMVAGILNECASYYRGAWWFQECYRAHLNGEWYMQGAPKRNSQGIIWSSYKGWDLSLMYTEMKVRKTGE